MTDADAMLKALMAVEPPPERDMSFTLAVMERVERRRFWLEVAALAPVALAAGLVLWALAPVLTDLAVKLIGPFGQNALLPILALVLSLAALAFTGREQARA